MKNRDKTIHKKVLQCITKKVQYQKSKIRKKSNMKRIQHENCNSKEVHLEKWRNIKRQQLVKRANTERIQQKMSGTWRKSIEKNIVKNIEKVRQEKCTTREKCNLKRVQNERVQHEKIGTRNGCKTKKCTLKWVEHKSKRNKVQHEKVQDENSATRRKVKHERSIRWKKCNTEKLQPQKCATRKRYNMKRVQYVKNATRKVTTLEKVQHEKKNTRWKKCNMEKVTRAK